MKRKLLCTLLCLCVVLGVCTLDVFAAEPNDEAVDWGLTLAADEVTPTGLTLVMSQSGGNYTGRLEFGSSYHLERRIGDNWERLPYITDKVAWTAQAYGLPENTVSRWSENWERIYGVLPEGHYRLVKSFWDFQETGDYDSRDFYAEFMIGASHTCESWDQDQLCDDCMALIPHECRNKNVDTVCDICGKKTDEFCVVGNADWMGSWDPDSEQGIMKQYRPDAYKVVFYDVPAGSYELQVIKHGSFAQSWGNGNGHVRFRNASENDVTVLFVVTDGIGVVSVEGESVELLQDDVYRVTGSTDWMGYWDPANDLGIMTYVGNGIYRKEFQDVPAGSYELKITKNGKWGDAYGVNGNNYCFTVGKKSTITVDFRLRGDVGVIEVYGNGCGWYDDEDEDQEKSADTDDLAFTLPTFLLLTCAVTLPVVLYKRKNTQ